MPQCLTACKVIYFTDVLRLIKDASTMAIELQPNTTDFLVENLKCSFHVQLSLEQQRFELHGSHLYMDFLSVNILENCLEICNSLEKNLFSSLL